MKNWRRRLKNFLDLQDSSIAYSIDTSIIFLFITIGPTFYIYLKKQTN